MGTWKTLHPRRILLAPCAITVHGDVSPGDPRTRALRFGAESSADRVTVAPRSILEKNLIGLFGFNVGLELRSGLLPTAWDFSLRMLRRHAIIILIFYGVG